MLTDDELRHRLHDLEVFNVERTESASTEKLGEAICVFANDLLDSRNGWSAKDNGECAGLEVTEEASAAGSEGGRPGKPCQDGRNASIRATPGTLTNCV